MNDKNSSATAPDIRTQALSHIEFLRRIRLSIWTAYLAGLALVIAINPSFPSSKVVIIKRSQIISLWNMKSRLGSESGLYGVYCTVENVRPDQGYRGGCRHLDFLERYVNERNDLINLVKIYEFHPTAFTVVFAPEDFNNRIDSQKHTSIIGRGCYFIESPEQSLRYLHLSNEAYDIDSCLFGGLLAYLKIDTTNVKSNPNLEYSKFMYNFVASPFADLTETIEYVRNELAKEGIIQEIVE